MSVRLSARMEKRDFHWTDFHEIFGGFVFEKLSRKVKLY
jgi:hypothetical protein